MPMPQRLQPVYQALFARYGPQHWWPADDALEVVVGAILTQAATWGNVEKAIFNLKQSSALNPAALHQLPVDELAAIVHPCGYYKTKALKLKAFARHLWEEYGGSLEVMLGLELAHLRRELLSIYGIGPETADSIILYAANKPVFVVDAYTRRITRRLGISPAKDDYAALQDLFMRSLPLDEKLFNEYHALLVKHAKVACRKTPLCQGCCLTHLCSSGG